MKSIFLYIIGGFIILSIFCSFTTPCVDEECSAEDCNLYEYDSLIPSYVSLKSCDRDYIIDNSSKSTKNGSFDINKMLNVGDNFSFDMFEVRTDIIGNKHMLYNAYYGGFKILDCRCTLHFLKEEVASITNNLRTINNIPLDIKIKTEEAQNKAMQAIDGCTKDVKCSVDTVIFMGQNPSDTPRLVFNCILDENQDLYQVLIDAETADVVLVQSLSCSVRGNANTMHYGRQPISTYYESGKYLLMDQSRHIITWNLTSSNGFFPVTDNDNQWIEPIYASDSTNAICEAHWAMGMSYDYFLNRFNRHGLDDNDITIMNCVQKGFNNSQYNGHDGNFKIGLVALDVLAHEFSHGVFRFAVGLTSSETEAGAINEGMSDIWAACVEKEFGLSDYSVWLTGDKLPYIIVHQRNLRNPKYTICPDTYEGVYWNTSRDVHINSTVMSHWFYLLCNGGSGINDNQDYYYVDPIEISKAEQICYLAETVYFTPTINYNTARNAMLFAARDLFGIHSKEYAQVMNAWHAVGVGNRYPLKITGDIVMCSQATYSISSFDDDVTWTVYPSNLVMNAMGQTCTISAPVVGNNNYYSGYVVAQYKNFTPVIKFFEVGDFVPDLVVGYHGFAPNCQEGLHLSSSVNYIELVFDSGYHSVEELSSIKYNTRLVNTDNGDIFNLGLISGATKTPINLPNQCGHYDVEVQTPCDGSWYYIWNIDIYY